MKLIRLAGVMASLSVTLLLSGCGDTYRPVVNPNIPPGGDPQYSNTAFVLNEGVPETTASATCSTPPCPTAGSVTQIDVPGDANMANIVVGRTPSNAAFIGAALYVANLDDNSLSNYIPSQIGPSYPTGPSVLTVSLPGSSRPVAVAGSSSYVYVGMAGLNQVGVISPATAALLQTINVSGQPVAMATTPDLKNVYVVTRDGNVTVIATLDNKILATIPVGANPVFAATSSDSNYVFVLNRGAGGAGSVTVISTASNKVMGTLAVGKSTDTTNLPLVNPLYFESTTQRLYVANSDDSTVTVYDLSAIATGTLPTAPLATVPVTAGSRPVSVVALSDGTRAYTANYGNGTVSVIDARNLTVKSADIPAGIVFSGKTRIPVHGTNTFGAAVAADGSKVYAINHDSTTIADPNSTTGGTLTLDPGTAIINTAGIAQVSAADTVVTYIQSPYQDPVSCTVISWTASTSYVAGARVTPTLPNGLIFTAQNAGTSAATEPTWCTSVGCTVTDNTGSNAITWVASAPPAASSCPRQHPTYVFLQR